MRQIIILFIFSIVSQNLISQNITFFNKNWKITEEENASFYRVIDYIEAENLYKIEDYYVSDSIQMKGLFHDNQAEYGKGKVSWYFENGNLKEETYYENWFPIGKSKIYFENGSVKEVRNYLKPDEAFKYAIQEYYSIDGDTLVYRGNGHYSKTFENGDLKIEGKLKFGFRVGKWQSWKNPGELQYTEYYNEQGNFIKGTSFDSDQNKYYYSEISVPAQYKKGNHILYKKISKKIRYPKVALDSGIEGVVYVQITIDEKGKIIKTKVLKGISEDCNEEALRVVRKYDQWIPGIQRGKAIKTQTILPIRFKI